MYEIADPRRTALSVPAGVLVPCTPYQKSIRVRTSPICHPSGSPAVGEETGLPEFDLHLVVGKLAVVNRHPARTLPFDCPTDHPSSD